MIFCRGVEFSKPCVRHSMQLESVINLSDFVVTTGNECRVQFKDCYGDDRDTN